MESSEAEKSMCGGGRGKEEGREGERGVGVGEGAVGEGEQTSEMGSNKSLFVALM